MSGLVRGQGCRLEGIADYVYLGLGWGTFTGQPMVLDRDGDVRMVALRDLSPCERPDWFNAERFPGWFAEPMTADSHTTHYRVCDCLADSAECCRPECTCHPPVLPDAPEGASWRLVEDWRHQLIMDRGGTGIGTYRELNAPTEPEPPAITVGSWVKADNGQEWRVVGVFDPMDGTPGPSAHVVAVGVATGMIVSGVKMLTDLTPIESPDPDPVLTLLGVEGSE